ncbi:hypothetical protein ABVT39_001865 [Epinephelus coioides]
MTAQLANNKTAAQPTCGEETETDRRLKKSLFDGLDVVCKKVTVNPADGGQDVTTPRDTDPVAVSQHNRPSLTFHVLHCL